MTILWRPSARRVAESEMLAFQRWLADERGLSFSSYGELWTWSVTELESFWACIWDYRKLGPRGDIVLEDRIMPGARWFPDTRLNYAERALDHPRERVALIYEREDGVGRTLTYGQLRRQVGAAAAGLRRLGVGEGDRVAALMPNCPQAVVGLLAAASLGAIWTACSPEFGAESVIRRFAQVQPTVLLTVDGYRYGGRDFKISESVDEIRRGLPGVRHVPDFDELLAVEEEPRFCAVAFDHPLWILYSSGTTGPPKAIVHGHGGIVLSALKDLGIQLEVRSQDRFFRFTTPAWVMWNIQVSVLLTGATVVMYDGHPLYPDPGALWRLAGRLRITNFGAGAAWIEACMRAGVEPASAADLSELHTVASTGSPLSAAGYRWLYEYVGADIHVASNCGGTDVCGPLLSSCAVLPVRAGEIQSRPLGVAAEAWDELGRPVIDEIGELVITQPLPSMPLRLWNDPDGIRLRESYFGLYPGVWRHGDWVHITSTGGAVVHGRSDATLNRGGVRMGTAEFYGALEAVPEVADAIVVDTSDAGAGGDLILFVQLVPGKSLDATLYERVANELRTRLSPRHVPDQIVAVAEIPYTLTGKRCEVPLKRLMRGEPMETAIQRDTLRNPASLDRALIAAGATTPSPPTGRTVGHGPEQPTASGRRS